MTPSQAVWQIRGHLTGCNHENCSVCARNAEALAVLDEMVRLPDDITLGTIAARAANCGGENYALIGEQVSTALRAIGR
jgi:hypothetical protein